MHKIYSLLRNNKQSGPYSLEELLNLNLKPFDLLWVEGKSGGWSYPSEIDALKPFVSEKKSPETKHSIPNSEHLVNAPTPLEKRVEVVEKKKEIQKKANHIYISLPAGIQTKDNSASYVKPLEEESPEAKLERKAQELRNKIQAFTTNKNQPKADNELDTKYARSLDDIKEEYSTWLHQQKKKKNIFPAKTALIALGTAALIIAAYFVLPFFQNKKNTSDHILSAKEIEQLAPAFQQIDDSTKSAPKKTFTRTGKSQNIKKLKKNVAGSAHTKKETNKTDSYKDALNKEVGPSKQETAYEPTYTMEDGTRQRTKRASESISNNPSEKKEPDPAPFEQLIKLSESIHGNSPYLTLYNNSNKFIKFVAIDAYYYKANKKLLEKKTFYFNDISAKNSVKLFVPAKKNAASVHYEMGLISTDSGLYYAKQ